MHLKLLSICSKPQRISQQCRKVLCKQGSWVTCRSTKGKWATMPKRQFKPQWASSRPPKRLYYLSRRTQDRKRYVAQVFPTLWKIDKASPSSARLWETRTLLRKVYLMIVKRIKQLWAVERKAILSRKNSRRLRPSSTMNSSWEHPKSETKSKCKRHARRLSTNSQPLTRFTHLSWPK